LFWEMDFKWLNNICAEMCVCLVQVESCPYKLCSVDLHFQCVSGVFFLSSCKHGRLCCWFLTYLVLFWVLFSFFSFFFFFGWVFCFCFRHIESLPGNLGVLSNDGFIKK
uniref:Uncharacterized protein n=1 Tax=Cairina moschata TaxID=8855 RepID=A0A8C3C886_CAIMO